MARFAAIGLDHRHVYDLTAGLLAAGATCVGHDPETTDPRVLAGFRKRFPDVPAMARERLLDDPSIDFIVLSAVPRDRAGLAIEAMRRGKDVMVDKPGVTTPEQLAAVEAAVRETNRIWSICLGRLTSPSVQAALAVVRSGELGQLVHLTSLAPHRLNRALRPAWFFERDAYGGIINDIGIHSIDQFLAFAEASGRHHRRLHNWQLWHAARRASRTLLKSACAPTALMGIAATGLVHSGWFARLGRRAVVPCRYRGHAGAAQEPGYCRQGRWRPYVRSEWATDTIPGLQRAAGQLLRRFPERRERPSGPDNAG